MDNVPPNQSNYITHPNQELLSERITAVDHSKGSEDVNKTEHTLTNIFSASPTMIQGNIKERNSALRNTQFESYSNQEQLNQSENISKAQTARENGQSSKATSFQGPIFQPLHYIAGLATNSIGQLENKQRMNGPFNQIEQPGLTSTASSSHQVMPGLTASTLPISAMSNLSLSATTLKSQSGNFSRLTDSQQSSPLNYPVSSIPSAMKVAPSSASPSQHSSASQSRSQSGAGTPVLGQFTSTGIANSQPVPTKSVAGPHTSNQDNFSLYGQQGSNRQTPIMMQNIFAPSLPQQVAQQDATQGMIQTASKTTSNYNPSTNVQHTHISNTQSSGLVKGSIHETLHTGATSQVSSSNPPSSYGAPSSSLAFSTGTSVSSIRPFFSQSGTSGSQPQPGPNPGQFPTPVKDQGTHPSVIRGTVPGNISLPTGSQNPPPGTFGPPTSNFGLSSSNFDPPYTYGPTSGTHSVPPGTYGPPSASYGPQISTRGLPPGTFGPQSGAPGPQSMTAGSQPRPLQPARPQGPPFSQYPAPSGMQGPLPGNQIRSSSTYGSSSNIQGPTSNPQGSQLGYLSQSSGSFPPAKETSPAPGSNILKSNSQFGLPPGRVGPTTSPYMHSNYPSQTGINSQGQMPQSSGPFIQGLPNQQMPPIAASISQMPSGPPVLNVGQQNVYAPAPEKNVFSTGPQMQNRYPQPISNQHGQQTQGMPIGSGLAQYPAQNTHSYKTNAMSVTKQGFDQLWGHNMVDLMQCRQVLPEYPEDPPEPKLQHQFAESSNCSPEIFRCTINRIPETNSLLQKSRLPLGILIHPFKDLNHLPVIQCATIVRCRACRTYINPFVYFVDSKRWKCNLCYRVNDLPEEFQYDPVSKSYGDPTRRPEIKSATIEFIAPGEYMLRPPQPAVYLFLLDVSQIARDSGYIQIVCETLKGNLDQLPGDARTQVGFICYDSSVHFYMMGDGLTRPREMTVIDIEEVFLPSPESLLVNLGEWRELVEDLLEVLPRRHRGPGAPSSALGAALQAAYKLISPTGGRITVFQTCLPNIGPGALTPREDPNARSSKEVAHLTPATDFYKRIALDCSGAQVAVDLFLINSQYSDLATLSGMSKFSGGTVYHIPLFKAAREWQAAQLRRMFTRYLTRKIGLEAVMRVRCTRGITIHTFHGNFFVRSTDLLSLPNVSPDAGFGMQLTIEESLTDLQQVCFQAALLYTSSKGERRIRVHTLCLPTASTLQDVLHSADTQCIIGLLSKMAVDRSGTAGLGEAREALMTVAVDALSAFRLAQNLPEGAHSSSLHAPPGLRLLPLYLLALLKHKAFRTGVCTRLDDRVHAMCELKTLPLGQLVRAVYPDLYPVHELERHLRSQRDDDDEEDLCPDLPRLHLSAERVNANGAYLLDDGEQMIVYVCHAVDGEFLRQTFDVERHDQLPDEARSLPKLDTVGSALLNAFVDRLNDERPYASNILILRDNSPSRTQFTERLVDDRVESSFSYYEFLNQVKMQVK